MSEPVCYYDEDASYNADSLYNGECPPEIIPTEALLRLGSSYRRKKQPSLFWCEFYVNVDWVMLETGEFLTANLNPVTFKCEENLDELPTFLVHSITIEDSKEKEVEKIEFLAEKMDEEIPENQEPFIFAGVEDSITEPEIKAKLDEQVEPYVKNVELDDPDN